jgi:acid phosphatase (class A)
MKIPRRGFLAVSCAAAMTAVGARVLFPEAVPYLTADEVDLVRLLPPPPSDEEVKAEIAGFHEMILGRSKSEENMAIADDEISIFRFLEGIEPQIGLGKPRLPQTLQFMQRLAKTGEDIVGAAKDTWQRPRPPLVDPTIKPLVPLPSSYAYPSGHAAVGMFYGLCLSDFIPDMRPIFMRRAMAFGQSRVIAGVHWPSDVKAGQDAAVAISNALAKNEEYLADRTQAELEFLSAFKTQTAA